MSTSINPLITVATFGGQSKYSQDFQQVLTRAVQLQSLNLQNLQIQQQNAQAQQNALQSLDNTFTGLQSAVAALSNATGLASLSTSVGNPSVASVSLSAGASTGVYTLEVTNLGSRTQTVSASGFQTVNNPASQNISSASSFTLTVDGVNTSVTPAQSTLQGLVDAINGSSSLGVTASIVNVGGSSAPDYRLALQSKDLGPVSVQLNDGANDLLDTVATGTLASYKLDGLPTSITSNSDTITLSPGVTVNLLGTNTGSPTTIAINQDTTAIQKALQSFVTAYNATADQLGKSHGQSGNALQGDSVLFSAQSALHAINGYTGGSSSPLSFLGLDLDNSGHLTFNSTEFQASASQGFSALSSYLGTSTSGFIQAANSALQNLEDPVTGAIKNEEEQLTASLNNLNSKIGDQVDYINNFQQTLLTQLSQSDAAIYQLEQQNTFYEGLFNTNNNNSNGN
jgi:flagellar hook-associated protein 2